MGKVEVGTERARAPDAPRFDAPVIGGGNLEEIGGFTPLEEPRRFRVRAWAGWL
jgi:hypothetical protein